ncbi:MAG: hypothetical protein ABIC57_03415 [bacterium]
MSPKKTPQELKEARERKKKEREKEQKRERIERIQEIKTRIKWEQISSELDGLYEELDKIYKKAPEEQISALTVESINLIVRDTKEIIKEDPYVNHVNEFVPAGDNPEYRDAIIILKRLKQGLERFKRSYLREHERLDSLISELKDLESEKS